MSKLKKLIVNCLLILIILSCYFYFNGYYLSNRECVEDSLRAYYYTDYEYVDEFKFGKEIYTLVANFDEMSCWLRSTEKVGFLYKNGSISSGYHIDESKSFDVKDMYNKDVGNVVIIYRNNKDIDYVTFELENGDIYNIDTWKKDFGILFIKSDNFYGVQYRAYDSNHQLIEEIEI